MAKWYEWMLNPIGSLVSAGLNALGVDKSKTEPIFLPFGTETWSQVGDKTSEGINKVSHWWENTKNKAEDWWHDTAQPFFENLYGDITGSNQIELQNKLDREMAEEEYQRNLASIGDTAAAYEAAGFNRNVLYGGSSGSPVQYSAPALQAYSGSAKIDTILQRAGSILKFIPAMYNATAALEKIDQERERTAQSQLKTTAFGLDILDKASRIDQRTLGSPYDLDIPIIHSKRTRSHYPYSNILQSALYGWNGLTDASYLDAAQKNRRALLDSIDLKNQLSRTRNSYLGYQYELDRRFGAAGKIVGMASQGLGSAANLLRSVGGLKKPNYKPNIRSFRRY